MKLFRPTALAFLSLLFLFSCNKNDDNNNGGGEGQPIASTSFTAKIDGNNFAGDSSIGYLPQGFNALFLQSVDGEARAFEIAIYDFDGEGTYPFSSSSESFAGYTSDTSSVNSSYTTQSENGGGSITVSEYNTTDSIISGTFSFIAQNLDDETTVDITEGSFASVKLKELELVPPQEDFFTVVIDNTETWEQTGDNISASSDADFINIIVSNLINSQFFLRIPDDITPGEYAFDQDTYSIIYFEDTITYNAIAGSILVSEHTQSTVSQIKAAFSFTGEGSDNNVTIKTFTNGSFDIEY